MKSNFSRGFPDATLIRRRSGNDAAPRERGPRVRQQPGRKGSREGMSSNAVAAVPTVDSVSAHRSRPLPAWIEFIDRGAIALLNVALVLEVLLVFANTMLRAFYNSSALMGVDEASPLFLITLAFMGGAVACSRGQFIAIAVLVDRASPAWKELFEATSEWIIVVVSLLIGGYSIPLILANSEERTILLGISYFWMTVPITAGCALFVIHACNSLLRRSWMAAVAGLLMCAAVALLLLATPYLATDARPLYVLLAAIFLGLIASRVPGGFVLPVNAIVCVQTVESGRLTR